MTLLIADTETTGIEEPECIELAYATAQLEDGALIEIGDVFCQRYMPTKPISYGAMSTHHIQFDDLVGCPPHKEAKIPAGTTYLIGHNIDFDWKVLGSPDVRRICTLAMARKMYPEMDSHKLGAVVYRLWPESAKGLLQNAHSAAADVGLCANVLAFMLTAIRPESIEALWQFSEKARIPTVMPFGKHRGTPISVIPADYKTWMLKQPDVDPYLIKALKGAAA